MPAVLPFPTAEPWIHGQNGVSSPAPAVMFSAKTAYGLVALLEIGSVHAGGGVLQVGEIARRQRIPERYLEQMLAGLRRAGLLRSLRGPRGGYQLARPPDEITVAEVVDSLEGDKGGERRGNPATPEFSVLADLEAALEGCRRELLAARTLQHLLEERDGRTAAPAMFFI